MSDGACLWSRSRLALALAVVLSVVGLLPSSRAVAATGEVVSYALVQPDASLKVAGKVFRIGHLGSLTDAMALSGVATAEMVMADLGLPVRLGSGVAAAQDVYRIRPTSTLKDAA